MADEGVTRFLVEWTEQATYRDVAYVSDGDVRASAGLDESEWAALGDDEREGQRRAWLSACGGVDEFGGTRRMRLVDSSDVQVVAVAPWALGTDAPL